MVKLDQFYIKKIIQNNYLTVLNLHKVSKERNYYYPALDPVLFEELIAYVKNEFEVVTFSELNNTSTNKPKLVLSFDDGYYDFYEYALPILNKHNCSANLNIIPECVETGEAMWNIKLYDFLNQASIAAIKKISLPGLDLTIEDTIQSKIKFGIKISRFLKSLTKIEREKELSLLMPIIQEADNITLTRMLSRDEIKEISKNHEIGAHSYEHESMSLVSDEYFYNDLSKCQDYFSNVLELPLDIYAFPNGSYKKCHVQHLLENGIKQVLLVENKYSCLKSKVHNRFTFYAETSAEMKLRAVGWYL